LSHNSSGRWSPAAPKRDGRIENRHAVGKRRASCRRTNQTTVASPLTRARPPRELFLRPRESVSDTAYGLDQCRLLGQRLDLVAEAPDVDLQVLRLVPVLGSPHAGEQRVVRERLARVRRELREKIELGGSEMDVLA